MPYGGCVLVLACKFNMEFIFRFEDLDIKRTVWSKVFCSPGSQNSLVILPEKKWRRNEEGKNIFLFQSRRYILTFHWLISADAGRNHIVKKTMVYFPKDLGFFDCYEYDSRQQFDRPRSCCWGWSRPQHHPSWGSTESKNRHYDRLDQLCLQNKENFGGMLMSRDNGWNSHSRWKQSAFFRCDRITWGGGSIYSW